VTCFWPILKLTSWVRGTKSVNVGARRTSPVSVITFRRSLRVQYLFCRSKVNWLKSLSIFGDKYPQNRTNGSKTAHLITPEGPCASSTCFCVSVSSRFGCGFRVSCLGLGVGFRVRGSGFVFGFRVSCLVFGFGFWASGVGCGFRLHGFPPRSYLRKCSGFGFRFRISAKVNMLGSRYKPVNFGAITKPGVRFWYPRRCSSRSASYGSGTLRLFSPANAPWISRISEPLVASGFIIFLGGANSPPPPPAPALPAPSLLPGPTPVHVSRLALLPLAFGVPKSGCGA